ncbi:MAG: MFS transporter [bacterium]
MLSAGYILVYFHRLSPAVLAVDMMRDLGAGGTLLGLLGAAYFYPYALMQMPAGLLSDSWGPRRSITLFLAIAVLGCVVLGTAPGAIWAIAGRALVGLGVSVFFVPTLKVLSEWFLPREFAVMTGLLLAVGALGMLSATEPLALMNAWIGWRASFLAVGGMTLAAAVLVWLVVRDRPGDLDPETPAPPRNLDPGVRSGLLDGLRSVARHPRFWPIAIWFFCTGGTFFTFGGLWGGPYLVQVHELGSAQAGRTLSMLAVGAMLGAPLLSYLSDHVCRARKPVIVVVTLLFVALTALLAFRPERFSPLGMYLFCFGLGVSSNAVAVIGFAITKELFPLEIAGTSTGLVNLFPFAGAAVLQPLLGAILESHGRAAGGAFTLDGYRHAFLVLFLCALAASASSFLMRETWTRS